MGILLPNSSVNRKVKKVPFADLSSIQRAAKTGWLGCPSDGVTRKIFSRAAEWTYVVAQRGGSTPEALGNSNTTSAFVQTNGSSSNGVYSFCTVTYTFKSSFLMRAGQTITLHATRGVGYNVSLGGKAELYINEDYGGLYDLSVNLKAPGYDDADGSGVSDATGTYTFASDTTISSICVLAEAWAATESVSGSALTDAYVTVNSTDFGSFLLNNSGASA